MLREILGPTTFTYPKSPYAVRDTLQTILARKMDALVLDFFAGSATTYQAVAMLNNADGGHRRAILVTNNELDEARANSLSKKCVFQGDEEFEQWGVAERIAWPRCKFITTGTRDDGTTLDGEDLDGHKLSNGFLENIEYFRLDFLDPDEVARGESFKAIIPILWMVAGCRGEREDSKGSTPWFIPKNSPYGVLIQEKQFRTFREKLGEREDIEWVFLITDSEENFGQMRRTLGRKYRCMQLYKSYLENFRINTQDALKG